MGGGIPALDAAMLPPWAWQAFAVAWGSIWGSFGNVVAYRLPRGESVVRPASHCPGCGKPVRWHDNVPVASWLALRGRCRDCGMRISPRYPLVEAGSAVLALLAMRTLLPGETVPLLLTLFFVQFAFLWALLVLAVIDLGTMLLPDAITLPGIVLGLAYTLARTPEKALEHSLTAAGAYLVVLVFFVLGYKLLARKEGMGMGDAKLLAMVGAMMGWRGALFTLVGGALQGLMINLPFLVIAGREAPTGKGRTDGRILGVQVPFGPALALAAFEYFFWGEGLVQGYYALVDRIIGVFL